jgi:hypothetical protein
MILGANVTLIFLLPLAHPRKVILLIAHTPIFYNFGHFDIEAPRYLVTLLLLPPWVTHTSFWRQPAYLGL